MDHGQGYHCVGKKVTDHARVLQHTRQGRCAPLVENMPTVSQGSVATRFSCARTFDDGPLQLFCRECSYDQNRAALAVLAPPLWRRAVMRGGSRGLRGSAG